MKKYGFTLIELLLSVAVICIVVAVTVPLVNYMNTKTILDTTIDSITQHMRQAQMLSQTVTNDASWGVKVLPGSVVIFQGSTYTTRDSSKDEVTELAQNVSCTGLTEIDYGKLFGMPSSNSVGIMVCTFNGTSRSITINALGTIAT